MTRFMLLDLGEELTERTWRTLAARTSRLKLLEAAAPFEDGQVVHVAPPGTGRGRSGQLVFSRAAGAFRLGPADAAGEVVGRVVAVERGGVSFSLDRGLLARVPPSWLPRALAALEVLGRLRHPLTPSLYLGSAQTCLAGVRDKYDREGEAQEYARLALTGLDPLEREIVERHVKPGGRILDIGCGAGREALGFARAGFRVVGIDVAPRMIELARANALREGLDITFRVQSVTELDEPPGSFDGAYWAASYHHVPGRALRVQTLGRIRRALTADGVLVLLVIYRGKRGLVSRSRLVDFLRRAGTRLSGPWRLSEPGDGYMRDVTKASDPREAVFFHDFFDPQELRAEIEAAGLLAEEVAPGWWVCRKALSH